MSAQGWIKFEKALREDIRVKRMAAGVAKLFTCNGAELQRTCAVTLVLGGLAQLWMHADTFARDDDTLEIGTHEIDELTGIEGFAKLMPPDWLEILDAESVKLPGFQGHNGVVAKRRALVSKRVSKHRTKVKREGVTHVDEPVTHNGYQTRPDQTRPRPDQTTLQEAPPNGASCASDFEAVKRAYPVFSGRQDWATAEHCCNHLVDRGKASWAELEEGARRYAVYTKAALTPSDRITHPKNFFSLNAQDEPWAQPWDPPASKAETRLGNNIAAAAEAKRRLFGDTQ